MSDEKPCIWKPPCRTFLFFQNLSKTCPNPTYLHQVDPTLDASLRELLARITPLCSHYSNVVQFCEDQSGAGAAGAAVGSGRVNQALAGALYSLVKDYYIFVTQVKFICIPTVDLWIFDTMFLGFDRILFWQNNISQ